MLKFQWVSLAWCLLFYLYYVIELELKTNLMSNMMQHTRPHLNKSQLIEEMYWQYSFGGCWFVRVRLESISQIKRMGWELALEGAFLLKRGMDIVISSFMLLLLSPLLLLTALLIKWDNPGPVFYNQTRVGKWGQLFKIYKFRSMKNGADQMKKDLMDKNEMDGVIFKMKDDPRVTHVGRFIRKLSIDELPQLWNVLKGDMSLVGPRPPVRTEVSQYGLHERKRLDIIPGITCIWQVSGRNNINFEGQVKLDIQYINNQTFWGDIALLFKTIPAVLFGKGAY